MDLIDKYSKATISIYSVSLVKQKIFSTRNYDIKLSDYTNNKQCELVSVSILELAIKETFSDSGPGPKLIFFLSSSKIRLEGNVTGLSDLQKKMYVVDSSQQGQYTESWKELATDKAHFAYIKETKKLRKIIKQGN